MEARAPNRSYVADRSDLYVLTDPKSIPLETHTPPQHLILRARRYINSLFTVLLLALIDGRHRGRGRTAWRACVRACVRAWRVACQLLRLF